MSQAQPAKPARSAVDPKVALGAALRNTLARFVTGVVVVSFDDADGPHGITVNAFTSVSMDPPLILVSIAKSSRSHAPLAPGIPSPSTCSAPSRRRSRDTSRAAIASIRALARGLEPPAPVRHARHFQCAPWRSYDAGDHTLLLGEVVDFDSREGDALGFFTSRFIAVPSCGSGTKN